MKEISQSTQKLIQRYQAWHQSIQRKENVPTIHVDEVASKVAAFYEKIRGVVDWREEHLLRRAAIERILKRRLLLEQNSKDSATPFVYELIRGGYFPNDQIEEIKIKEVQNSIDKYIFILNNTSQSSSEKLKIELYDWLLSLAACEVEEILDPLRRERALIEYMEESMKEKILFPTEIIESDKDIQISIAVQKALFKLDKPIISYHLFKKYYPNWLGLTSPTLDEVTKNIYLIWKKIEKDLKHPLIEKIYRICERYDTPYLILGDILSGDPFKSREKIETPEVFENLIREAYSKRLKQIRSRAGRAALYSTISIFISKMLVALLIEVPFDKYITGDFSYQTLGLNILIPPSLMFFLVLTIPNPRKSNLEKVVIETMKITFTAEKKDVYPIRSLKKRSVFLNFLITLFYLATFVVSFGLIWWGLEKLNFGILSRIIFIIFFSLICFAGVKVRERSKELIVEEGKEGFLSFLLDSFSLPFIRMGKWLSNQWARYNIIMVFLTFLIDMPFQIFVEFLEQWRRFIKEKKEEIH